LASPGHEPITYRQLLDQLDSTIESLREIGIGRNDRIAIVLPNGIEMAVLFLGVSCAAISVPLNPSYLENEFEFYLRDIGVKALVVQSGAQSPAVLVAQRHGIPVIELVSSSNAAAALFTLKASRSISSASQHTVEPDIRYEKIMSALGGHAEFVDRAEQLGPALRRAMASGKAACVNVQVDPYAPYPND